MKILTVVKSTGYNFIRHYLPYFPPGSKVVHNEKGAMTNCFNFDVILFEWANDLTANIINSTKFQEFQDRFKFKVVVRIHDHEVRKVYGYGRRIDFINWERVDKIWFINPLIRDQFHQLKGHQEKTFYLPNAVDPELFPEHRADTKIAGLTSLYFRERKRIDRVVPIAKLLPDWEFHIRVEIPPVHANSEFYNQYQKFRIAAKGVDNIFFDHRDVVRTVKQHYQVDDYIDWWKDKSVTLSLSNWEGYGYNIGEPMAMGKMPVVWNWPGSDQFWYPWIVDSPEAAAERIANYEPSGKYRRYILDYYHPESLTKKMLEQIN